MLSPQLMDALPPPLKGAVPSTEVTKKRICKGNSLSSVQSSVIWLKGLMAVGLNWNNRARAGAKPPSADSQGIRTISRGKNLHAVISYISTARSTIALSKPCVRVQIQHAEPLKSLPAQVLIKKTLLHSNPIWILYDAQNLKDSP